MPSLTRNESVQTIKGNNITILDYIAEGGQGEVYKVDYKGQKYAPAQWPSPAGEAGLDPCRIKQHP